MNRNLSIFSTFVFALGFFAAGVVLADSSAESATDPAFRGWTFSLGQFDILDEDYRTEEAGIEYRFRPVHLKKLFRWENIPFVPMIGVAATSEEAFWVYAGFRYDWWISDKWAVTPSFAVSYYDQGDGKDLGHEVEFRSGIEISRQISRFSRVGLHFNHLSNSSIDELNPGSESLLLVWSLGR